MTCTGRTMTAHSREHSKSDMERLSNFLPREAPPSRKNRLAPQCGFWYSIARSADWVLKTLSKGQTDSPRGRAVSATPPFLAAFRFVYNGECAMCTMTIPSSVCRKKPVRIVRDHALDGLADYVRQQCATPASRDRYLKRIGLSRKNGRLVVQPL